MSCITNDLVKTLSVHQLRDVLRVADIHPSSRTRKANLIHMVEEMRKTHHSVEAHLNMLLKGSMTRRSERVRGKRAHSEVMDGSVEEQPNPDEQDRNMSPNRGMKRIKPGHSSSSSLDPAPAPHQQAFDPTNVQGQKKDITFVNLIDSDDELDEKQLSEPSLVVNRMSKIELKDHYNAEEFLELIREMDRNHDTFMLQELVRHVFGSERVLGRCFLAESLYKAGAKICLDFISIRIVYKELIAILKKHFSSAEKLIFAQAHALESARQSGIKLLPTMIPRIRMLVLMLENPLTSDPVYYNILTGPLCMEIQNLTPQIQDILVNYFTQYDREGLRGIVVRLQTFLTVRLYSTFVVNMEERAAIGTLSIFSRTNKECHLLPLDDFYNDAVNNVNCNLDQEYIAWREYKQYGGRCMAPCMSRQFSFFDYSFLLAPYTKSRLIRREAQQEQQMYAADALYHAYFHNGGRGVGDEHLCPYLVITVNRATIVQDTVRFMEQNRLHLKKPLRVIFRGEEGVDAGGVTKEYFQLLIRELLSEKLGLFSEIPSVNTLWFNTRAPTVDESIAYGFPYQTQHIDETKLLHARLKMLELFGKVVALAIYNNVNLDLSFPLVVYKKLKNYKIGFDDLIDTFPELGTGLEKMKTMSEDDLEALGCTFEVTVNRDGGYASEPLKANGENIPVRIENREEFLRLYADFKLSREVYREFTAFQCGFAQLCNSCAIDLCEPEELEQLICGSAKWDFDQLQKAAQYSGFAAKETTYKAPGGRSHKILDVPVLRYFWDVFHELDEEDKKKFLFFVTGTARAPIRGFSKMKFVIMNGGTNEHILPTSHTCFNTLILPQYKEKQTLRDKMMIALENCEGFGLR